MTDNKHYKLERQVLGEILIEKDAIGKVVNLLSPECFEYSWNRAIYQTMLLLYNSNIPIDALTVAHEIHSKRMKAYVLALTRDVDSATHLVEHAELLVDKTASETNDRFDSEAEKKYYKELYVGLQLANIDIVNSNVELAKKVKALEAELKSKDEEIERLDKSIDELLARNVKLSFVLFKLNDKLPFWSRRILKKLLKENDL